MSGERADRQRRVGKRTSPAREILEPRAEAILGRRLTPRELEGFESYLRILLVWQRSQRLVGSDDPVWIVERLFLDSLLFRAALPSPCPRLLDLGAGAGFPGLPLKIVGAAEELVLLEARRRRASFLASAVREIGLANVSIVNDRAEAVVSTMSGSFDAVVMRCAGDPSSLLTLALAFVVPGGGVVAGASPTARPVAGGDVIAVRGVRPGETRRLLVARRP